jgi:hypothetical protein
MATAGPASRAIRLRNESIADSRQKQAAGGDVAVADESFRAACRSLQSLQRRRVTHLKARIAIDNQLAAIVATELGYHAGMNEDDRKSRRAEAAEAVKLIEAIDTGDDASDDSVSETVSGIVLNTKVARDGLDGTGGFNGAIKAIEKEMAKLAASLPGCRMGAIRSGFRAGQSRDPRWRMRRLVALREPSESVAAHGLRSV